MEGNGDAAPTTLMNLTNYYKVRLAFSISIPILFSRGSTTDIELLYALLD